MPDRLKPRGLTDGQRFAILVPACLAIGTGLCFGAGMLTNGILETVTPAPLAAFLVVAVVIGALAASCWSFIALVNRLYRRTY
jgi:hypothetical protein